MRPGAAPDIQAVEVPLPWARTESGADLLLTAILQLQAHCGLVPGEELLVAVACEYTPRFAKVMVGAGMYLQALKAAVSIPEGSVRFVVPAAWNKAFKGSHLYRKVPKQTAAAVSRHVLGTENSSHVSDALAIALSELARRDPSLFFLLTKTKAHGTLKTKQEN
jgi:hypothetical protein